MLSLSFAQLRSLLILSLLAWSLPGFAHELSAQQPTQLAQTLRMPVPATAAPQHCLQQAQMIGLALTPDEAVALCRLPTPATVECARQMNQSMLYDHATIIATCQRATLQSVECVTGLRFVGESLRPEQISAMCGLANSSTLDCVRQSKFQLGINNAQTAALCTAPSPSTVTCVRDAQFKNYLHIDKAIDLCRQKIWHATLS